jgi:hypothetical protein
VDGAGRAYVAGNENDICSTSYVFQSCFPTTGGAVIGGDKPGGRSGQYAFVAAFDPTGAHLLYSTLLGDLNYDGGGSTWATGITVDRNGYFYLIGDTQAGQLPTTAGVIQPTSAPLYPGGVSLSASRGLIAKFNPVTSAGGASLAYSTYLGGQTGNLGDYISGIAVDSASNAYVVGYTNSKDFPVTQGAYSTVCGPNGGTCAAAHVTKLNSTPRSVGATPYTLPVPSNWMEPETSISSARLEEDRDFPWSIPLSQLQPAGLSRCWSPNSTPQAPTCCSPQPSDPTGSTPRLQPGW